MEFLQNNLNVDRLLTSPVLYGLVSLTLGMYGPRLSPKLPQPVKDLFNNKYFRFAVILLITFLSSNNLQLAVIITIGFCLITSYANSMDVEENFLNEYRENYSNFDTIRELKEHYPKDVENSMNMDTQKLNEPESNNEEEIEGEESSGVEEFSGNRKCSNGLTDNECVAYCYSQAGMNDEFCKKRFPNPQNNDNTWINCKNAEGVDQQKNCLSAMCKIDSSSEYCQKLNESKANEQFDANPLVNKLNDITDLVRTELEKYKNPID